SLVDWLMSGIFTRFPDLKIAYSEGSIGWIPYVIHRADVVWEENRGWGGIADKVKVPPSELYFKHVLGCFFDDPHGLLNLERIAALGDVDDDATETYDADGLVVTPGFIDNHTHYDAQLFWDPMVTPSNVHGVTTVLGGNCGFTLAPIKEKDADYIRRMMQKVE